MRQPIDVGAAVKFLRERGITDFGDASNVDVLQANNGMSKYVPSWSFQSHFAFCHSSKPPHKLILIILVI